MAPDLLSTIQSEINARLDELRPLLDEYHQLLAAADALFDTDEQTAAIPAEPQAKPSPRKGSAARTQRGSAAGVIARVVAEPTTEASELEPAERQPKSQRAQRGAAREAILGALEHGSHTIGELAVVTAMSGPNINGNLRRLIAAGVVVKTERESKTAYALTGA